MEGFDVTPDYRQDWTNNMDALTAGIQALRPGGGTALYDAVYSACRDKLLTARGQEPVRKAIVLVSDGDDNQSHAYLEDAIKECQRAETNHLRDQHEREPEPRSRRRHAGKDGVGDGRQGVLPDAD